MTTTVSLPKSHDVSYFNAGHGALAAAPGRGPMTPDPVNCQVSGMGTGLMSWRQPGRSAPARRTVQTAEIEQVGAEARAKSGPKSRRTST
jgi:hypothetical protein